MKKFFNMFSVFSVAAIIMQMNVVYAAEWVPLITSTTFDGIRSDVLATATGIVSIMVVVIGIGILWRHFSK